MENNRFAQKLLWNSYAIVYGDKVRRTTRKEESEALTNIIQLVRFAYHQTENWKVPILRLEVCLIFGMVENKWI